MKAERISKTVHKLTTPKSLFTLQCSDIHYDSPYCDRTSLKKHFDEVKDRGGQICIYGDLFDVMGCYKDPRTKAADIRSEYIQKGRSYLDLVVDDVYEFLKPYKQNIAIISYGNHETAILKHRDTDPLDRLIFRLNQLDGKDVMKGAYAGWLVLAMKRSKAKCSFRIAYHHGKGGNAKRSKGVLYSQIDAFQFPDANLIVSGHDHNKIWDPSNVRNRLSAYDNTYNDTVHWLKSGSYALSPEGFGYVVERGFLPKRMGGWFVDFDIIRDFKGGGEKTYVEASIREAIPVRSYIDEIKEMVH